MPADYDGDGPTDVAVYRPADGVWFMRGIGAVAWGGEAGDIPQPGNYDGDGHDDQAVYRDGAWYIRDSGAVLWRSPGDVPVNLPVAIGLGLAAHGSGA